MCKRQDFQMLQTCLHTSLTTLVR